MASGELASPLQIAPALRPLEAEYEFLREVGRGGMAAVYLARARASGRVVAIKTVASHRAQDPEAVARFEREARTVLALDHPNIVRSYSVEQLENGALAIIMQHATGGTLRDALRSAQAAGEQFPVERVASIVADVAEALGHAHDRGVVHRDVKPENIFLDPRNGRALLSDFGIARNLEGDNALTMTGSAIGTPTYMSPEQIDGRRVDGRSDVYALGLVGWEMLAGARPWEGDSLYTVIYKQKHEGLAPLSEVRPDAPRALRAAIERALRKEPADRWPDAHAFAEAVREAVPPPAPAIVEAAPAPTVASVVEPAPSPAELAEPVAAEPEPAGVEPVFETGDESAVDEQRPAYAASGHTASAPLQELPHDETQMVRVLSAEPGPEGVATPGEWEEPRRPTTVQTLRARYGSARPAARLAVPLALALVAAFAVRQSTQSRRARAADDSAAAVATSVTVPAAGDVAPLDSLPAEQPAANPPLATTKTTELGRPAGSGTPATPAARPAANTPASTPATAPATRAPIGLARFAVTHGDSLALCRSAAPRDQRACFQAVLFDRDAPLNAVYVQLVRELRRRDPTGPTQLRAEELRWLAERDGACARAGRAREGALWAESRAACLGDAADRRASELTARLAKLRAR